MSDEHPVLEGECGCCGQRFIERLRVRPVPGVSWTGVLRPHAQAGVCPRCHNEYGISRGQRQFWSEDQWRAHHADRIAHLGDSREADLLSQELEEDFPYLAAQARTLAQWLRQVEATREVDELVQLIRHESSAQKLEHLATEIHLRWPDLAEDAMIKSLGLHYVAELQERTQAQQQIAAAETLSTVEALARRYEAKGWDDLAVAAEERLEVLLREQEEREREAHRKREERQKRRQNRSTEHPAMGPSPQDQDPGAAHHRDAGAVRSTLWGALSGAALGAPLAIVISAGSCLMDLPDLVAKGATAANPPLHPLWIVIMSTILGTLVGAARRR